MSITIMGDVLWNYTYYEELSDKSSLVQIVGEVVEALLVEAISIEAKECDERCARGKGIPQFFYFRLWARTDSNKHLGYSNLLTRRFFKL